MPSDTRCAHVGGGVDVANLRSFQNTRVVGRRKGGEKREEKESKG